MNDPKDDASVPSLVSPWLPVTQEMIDRFGTTTLDIDPMHMDPVWAQRNSPFHGTIAYGFLTMSLLTHLYHSARKASVNPAVNDPATVSLNYGFNRMRLVRPVPVGSRIRGHFTQRAADQRTRSGHDATCFAVRIEIEGQEAPALVGDWLGVGIPGPAAVSASK